LTAFLRAPAEGLWAEPDGSVDRDDILVVEVMASDLDRTWWEALKNQLEKDLQQETIIIRASTVQLL
jgi:hypothetical protein